MQANPLINITQTSASFLNIDIYNKIQSFTTRYHIQSKKVVYKTNNERLNVFQKNETL